MQSLKDSPFYSYFADRLTIWESRLSTLDQCLQQLNQIQRKWVYLEPIFGRGALPSEQSRFKAVSDDFRNIMLGVARDDRVVTMSNNTNFLSTLNMMLDQLQRCQKALNQFLEEKRSLFPRFYFLGDEDLLEILGQATQPTIIQAHLKKLFGGIHQVDFDDTATQITAIKSLQGEKVELRNPVKVIPQIEEWLASLAKEVRVTLKVCY